MGVTIRLQFSWAGALAVVALLVAGCFDRPEPDLAFRCGADQACPVGYECRDDGCCHRIGSTGGECPGGGVDAATDASAADAGPDAMADAMADAMTDAAEPDAAPDAGEPDAGEPDAGEPDAGEPDAGESDAAPPPALVSLTPASVVVSAGATVDLTVTIDAAAPAGGVAIGVAADPSDGSVVAVPTTVFVAEGDTTATVTVTGVAGGFARVTVSLDGDEAGADVAVAATSAAAGDLVVSEFLALTSGPGNAGELVELLNTSGVILDLAGWELGAGTATNALLAPSLVAGSPIYVAPGQTIYGVPNPADAGDIPGDAGFVYGPAGAAIELDDGGTTLSISDGTTILDAIDFTGWLTTAGATPTGSQFAGLLDRSTQLAATSANATDNDDGGNWCVPASPTPGGSNADCSAALINEVLADPAGDDEGEELIELALVPGYRVGALRLRAIGADGTPTAIDVGLSSSTRAPLDGLLVLADATGGSTAVANADIEVFLGLPNQSGGIQLIGPGGALLDALGYGTLMASVDTDLGLAIVEGTPATMAEGSSLARDAASTDTDDNATDFSQATPTPGAPNP